MEQSAFYKFLEERKQSVTDDITALTAEGRSDDANILKAKFNVYDIAKSVYDAAAKQNGDTAVTFPALFKRITDTWRISLDAAKAHGDDRKVLIEEAKLSAVTEINTRFTENN